VRREEEGTWVLAGPPPESFTDLHRQLGSPIEPATKAP
jgi:hypothetical protein